MSQKTDTNPRCGSCVQMREEDGYCKHLGRYVNYFRVACKDYVDRIECAEKEALASMPEPEEPEVRVKAEAKIRRKALLHPDPKPGTRICKVCGRELPLDQFTRSCKSRDGYTHTCKECFSAQMSEKKKALWASKPKKEKPVQEQEVLPEGQKRCRRCGRILPVTAFGRHATTPDHLHPTCTECRKAEGRAVYERNCARKGITPKPPRVDVPVIRPKEDMAIILNEVEEALKEARKEQALRTLTDEELVAELRRRGWTITATKEL